MRIIQNTNKKSFLFVLNLIAVIFSSLLQCYTIKVFMQSANLLSSGFTGVALLLNSLTDGFINTSIAIILLNVPIALICYKSISPRFTFLSCVQFFSTSFFLTTLNFEPLFTDVFLNVAFGGFAYGLSIIIALKADASTGGTDFIALYFSTKFNKSLWQYVFIFNCFILVIFGYTTDWSYAAYSILFQFISTKTIETFHNRYNRLTLQITTSHPEQVISLYTTNYRHGLSCLNGYGGYSQQPFTVLNTVVSSYEVKEIVTLLKSADPNIIVNIFKTEDFIGGFYQKPIQ